MRKLKDGVYEIEITYGVGQKGKESLAFSATVAGPGTLIKKGAVLRAGTTNEEILAVLLDRMGADGLLAALPAKNVTVKKVVKKKRGGKK